MPFNVRISLKNGGVLLIESINRELPPNGEILEVFNGERTIVIRITKQPENKFAPTEAEEV
jgi:hypothetical protein